MKLAERAAGFDAELVDKRGPRCLEGLECLGLAVAAVQAEHQLTAQALPQRMLRDERLELADESAWRPVARSASIRCSSAGSRSSSSAAMSASAKGS